jgi:hypothetical protein
MEEGLLLHMMGNYYQSSLLFDRAMKVSGDLFTQRISKTLAKTAANDNYEEFRGEVYELSMLYFYQTLNFFLLYQNGKQEAYEFLSGEGDKKSKTSVPEKQYSIEERSQLLRSARATLLAWDAFWKTWRFDNDVDSVFKNDLGAKLLAGFVHESVNTSTDDQIALQLYKDAREILVGPYQAYPSFNQNFAAVKLNKTTTPLSATPHVSSLIELIDKNILTLTKKRRPSDFKSTVERYKINEQLAQKVLKKNSKSENVVFIFQKDLITQKTPENYNFGFENLAKKAGQGDQGAAVIYAIGVPVLTYFAAEKLGLYPSAQNWSTPKAYLGMNVAEATVRHVGIEFEMAKIENSAVAEQLDIEIVNENNKKVYSQTVPLINPLNDIAQEVVAEVNTTQYLKRGTRIALKYMTAIATAYTTYQGFKKQGEFFAKNAALLAFLGASKTIAASEKADVRHWTTLPGKIYADHFSLPAGNYQLSAIFKSLNSPSSNQTFGPISIVVRKDQVKTLVNLRKMTN